MPLRSKYQKIKAAMVKKYGTKKGTQVFWAWINKQGIKEKVEQKAYFFVSEQFKAFNDDYVKGDIAVGTPDIYNDILTEDCLKDMEKQMKELPITIDDNHESFKEREDNERLKNYNPIAKVESAKLDGFKIGVKAVLNKAHKRYEEIKSSIKNGFLHSFSFAYIPIDYQYKSIDGVRHRLLEKVRVLNGCFTGVPVQPESQFNNVALKSLNDFTFDEKEVNNLIGGMLMGEKDEPKEEKPKEEAPKEEAPKEEAPKEEAPKEEAPKEETPKEPEGTETKALKEKLAELGNGFTELKSLIEKGNKSKDIKEQLKAITEKQAEFDKVLSAPQFKARMEQMEEINNMVEEKSKASKGPLDQVI